MLLLTASDINRLTDMAQLIDDVGEALANAGRSDEPEMVALKADRGSFEARPARAGEAVGLCWNRAFDGRDSCGQPDVQTVFVINDQHTGCPLALLDGGSVLRVRTAATLAVATRALARTDAHTIGLVGCDPEAATIMDALRVVRSISEVRLYDLECRRATVLAALLGFPAREAHRDDALGADIVVLRPGPTRLDWGSVLLGSHVSLPGVEMGQESTVESGKPATMFQAVDGSLARVLKGAERGRRDDREITVFCGHGGAAAAVAAAMSLYRQALRRGIGAPLHLG